MSSKNAHDAGAAGVSRRMLLGGAAALGTGAALPAASPVQTAATPQPVSAASNYAGPVRIATPPDLTVETTHGKVRGYLRNGILTFKGMRYGATTAGAARFLPPSKPQPWSGVYEAVGYGHVCPQGPNMQWNQPPWVFIHQWDNGNPGEDCLRVNVWTPSAKPAKKKPVMVWLHGGGWSGGSGQELTSYEGENLARRGDIVMVSVNHRLNVFGFLNLSEIGGEKYADSGLVGFLDLVAALEWVRDNIASFGGDPANVMIFGQSGGGSKVCHLMASPLAKGLFHKGAVQSGAAIRSGDAARSLKSSAAVLAELGITQSNLDKLQTLPASYLIEAMAKAGGMFGGPYVDGKAIPAHPFDPAASALAANIPLLIGNNTHEGAPPSVNDPELERMTFAQMRENLAKGLGEKTDKVIEIFRAAHPKANAVDLQTRINCWRSTGGGMGGISANTLRLAEIKAAQPAPVYRYLFGYCTPMLDGRPRGYHCAELPYVFDNIDRCPVTGGTAEARSLGAKMSQAWISLARNSNPGHAGLPDWPALKPGQPNAMVFDSVCTAQPDYDGEGRKLLGA